MSTSKSLKRSPYNNASASKSQKKSSLQNCKNGDNLEFEIQLETQEKKQLTHQKMYSTRNTFLPLTNEQTLLSCFERCKCQVNASSTSSPKCPDCGSWRGNQTPPGISSFTINTSSNSLVNPKVDRNNSLIRRETISKEGRAFLRRLSQAIHTNKVFRIGNGNGRCYPAIRESLVSRGWVEKCSLTTVNKELLPQKLLESMTRLLDAASVNFKWTQQVVDFGTIDKATIVNRYPKNTHFTTKVGLCNFLENFYWFYQPGVSHTVTPRTISITNDDDIEHFAKEFRLTACVTLLKIVIDHVANAESDQFFRDGEVPTTTIDFANSQCAEYISSREHCDIDPQEEVQTPEQARADFLHWFYQIVHKNEHFQTTQYPKILALYSVCKSTLKRIQPYLPQLEIEGVRNLWVVKPSDKNCGRGITVMRDLNEIISHLRENKTVQYVVQKYIEKPLLVYDTKFDIRQWFVITSVCPLVIWIYKECYLRFSSQPFSLESLHKSVHLTNNAVQKFFTNDCSRDSRLPRQNMWHNSTFQQHLKEIGEPSKWENVILPGIKQAIVGAVLASQDDLIERQNSFELYGADLLVGADFTTLLLEINVGPDMSYSTNVTADLCSRGLRDLIKLVLDRKYDQVAETGQFEMLYKQETGPRHQHGGLQELPVIGSRICRQKCTKVITN